MSWMCLRSPLRPASFSRAGTVSPCRGLDPWTSTLEGKPCRPGFETVLCQLLAVCPWAGH